MHDSFVHNIFVVVVVVAVAVVAVVVLTFISYMCLTLNNCIEIETSTYSNTLYCGTSRYNV
jgi:hypothetical protein